MSRHGVFLCEGYHDRAFLSGWLETRGWSAKRTPSGAAHDPGGRTIGKGSFAFERGESFVKIQPCEGWTNIKKSFESELKSARQRVGTPGAVDAIIPCFDDDIAGTDHVATIRAACGAKSGDVANGGSTWNEHGITVQVILLRSSDGPWRQSLDGVVARSFAEAHPQRAGSIDAWLRSRPEAPEKPGKEALWAVMAGWFADQGCEGFLRIGIWKDHAIRERLEKQLDELGLTRVAELLER